MLCKYTKKPNKPITHKLRRCIFGKVDKWKTEIDDCMLKNIEKKTFKRVILCSINLRPQEKEK